MVQLGIDLGGTKIEGIILQDGRIQYRERIPTEQTRGYDHILSNINRLYQKMVEQIDGGNHTFGIGTPGAISTRTGLLKNSNTVCLNGRPLRDDLEDLLQRPVVIQNDANCFALAEALHGAGRGYDMVFGVIMGTGCGGGIVYRGDVWTGRQAIGGEWGHAILDRNGPLCYCGQRGCVETFISGGGLENLYQRQFGERPSLRKIVQGYRDGSASDVSFMQTFFDNFGRALANLINVLDPDVIVLGGGVSNIDELYSSGRDAVARYIFNDILETPIVRHQLGDSAGVIGAALVGR